MLKTNEKFIEESNNIHNNKYEYPDKYINDRTKIYIKCLIHGNFKQSPNNHLKGNGCPLCKGGVKKTNDDFIVRSNEIHNNKYEYPDKYINAITKIEIFCQEHGIFHQTPHDHLSGRGCPKCVGKNRTHQDFINDSNKIHNNKYEYPDKYMKANKKIKIRCFSHGDFEQTPDSHLRGSGCPKCKESRGENIISNYLKSKEIEFISEKKFKNCKYKNQLPFDFYLPNHNMCIEYDGIQHYYSVPIFGGYESLNKTKFKDNIKNEYCKNNNINLVRIKYDENIHDVLDKIIY